MSEAWLFVWGVVAFSLAVGPLVVAALLDLRSRNDKKELERAAGVQQDGTR
jgi:hypothetical protein